MLLLRFLTFGDLMKVTTAEQAIRIVPNWFCRPATPFAPFCDRVSIFMGTESPSAIAELGVYMSFAPTAAHRTVGKIKKPNPLMKDRLQRSLPIEPEGAEEFVAITDKCDVTFQKTSTTETLNTLTILRPRSPAGPHLENS